MYSKIRVGQRIFLFAVFFCTFATCRKDDSPEIGLQPPAFDLTGNWFVQQQIMGNCQGISYPVEVSDIDRIEHNKESNEFKFYLDDSEYVTGSIEGDNVTWEIEFEQNNGITSTLISTELSNDGNSFTGSSEWYWNHNDSEYSCSGTATIKGHRINNSTEVISLTANPDTVLVNIETQISCIASDTDNDPLSYTWFANSGTIIGSGNQVTWLNNGSTGAYDISCIVTDNKGNHDSASVKVIVIENPPAVVVNPPDRYAHTMVYLSDSNQVLLFGGQSHESGALNDLWAYSLDNYTWREISISGSIPEVRAHAAMALINSSKCILLFGGSGSGENHYNDTWLYRHELKTWSKLSPGGDVPVPREAHALEYIGGDQVILTGGHANNTPECDTWLFDLSDNSWTLFSFTSPDTVPPKRYGHDQMVFIDSRNELYLFGGVRTWNSPLDLNDLWTFNTLTKKWTELIISGEKPVGRRHHAIAYGGNNNLILHGGSNYLAGAGIETILDDLWEFNVTTNTWTQIIATGDKPQANDTHDIVYIGNNKIFMYSRNTVRIYNTITEHWTAY